MFNLVIGGRSVEITPLRSVPLPRALSKRACYGFGQRCALHFRWREKRSSRGHTIDKKEVCRRAYLFFMVEVWRFELQASSTRNWRATNCATPRCLPNLPIYYSTVLWPCQERILAFSGAFPGSWGCGWENNCAFSQIGLAFFVEKCYNVC